MMKRYYFLTLTMVFILGACSKDDEVINTVADNNAADPQVESENLLVNTWIWEEMNSYYLWKDNLPDVLPNAITDPNDYFRGLIYKDDRFSWITDDADALLGELEGEAVTMGYAPAFGLLNSSSQVFIIVEYVYPNSPAADAGLKRGDIILTIDGQPMNTDNYYDLYTGSSYTAGLGKYENGKVTASSASVSLTARFMELDPVLHAEVKEVNGTKIGYLVYAEFVTGNGDKWLQSLGKAITDIKNKGATEMIVDLRYNPGGNIDAAGYFASTLAPAMVVADHDVLVNFEYNTDLENYIRSQDGDNSENLVYKFPATDANLNLNRVVFLTTGSTASASELLINGLKPYMDVISVGETTVGKFYGSWVLTDFEEPARHSWAMMPLVLKYANAQGVTDFADGLVPDYELEDDLLLARAFGNLNDPLLAKGIEVITGYNPSSASRMAGRTSGFKQLEDVNRLKKHNILRVIRQDNLEVQ